MFWRGLLCGAVVVVAVFLCVACGADKGKDDSHRPLTRKEYIRQLNQLQKQSVDIFIDVSEATVSPASARPHLASIDELIGQLRAIDPPRAWRKDHAEVIKSLVEMRDVIAVLSRVPSSKTVIVKTQIGLYQDARERYEAAVSDINQKR